MRVYVGVAPKLSFIKIMFTARVYYWDDIVQGDDESMMPCFLLSFYSSCVFAWVRT